MLYNSAGCVERRLMPATTILIDCGGRVSLVPSIAGMAIQAQPRLEARRAVANTSYNVQWT